VVKAAIAFGLAGIAAAGGAWTLASAPRTDAAALRVVAGTCDPAERSDRAVQKTELLRVNGRRVRAGVTAIKAADWLKTNERGSADVCLTMGSTLCWMRSATKVRVLPPNLPDALVWLAEGSISCKTLESERSDVWVPGRSIRLDALGLADGQDRLAAAGGGGGATGGHLFAASFRGGTLVVKMSRGAAVVSRTAAPGRAVVLGRQQQVTVPRGRDPQAPKPAVLTAAESTAATQLARRLPPVTDREAPAVTMTGPRDPSSARRAVFAFQAGEAAVFSCALDGQDFRLCAGPETFPRLAPGRHTFAVRATDATGNTRTVTHTWTIDGSRIAFASDRGGNADVYAMDPDGLNQVQLTESPATDTGPEWSRDGRRIAFESQRDGNSEIYVMNADGGDERRITQHQAIDRNPTWSPDGRIAFESWRDGNRELYVMNADGTNVRRLTDERAEDLDPTWAPDGSSIAFASTRDGNYELYVMNADGGNVRRLTDNGADDFGPSWSPDGRTIAFHSRRSSFGTNSDIYVVAAGGGEPVQLTDDAFDDYNPAWSPDGAEIVFQSTRANHPRMDIYVMHADGSEETRLTTGPGNEVPDW
jgi:Tol biopolymer transport system component